MFRPNYTPFSLLFGLCLSNCGSSSEASHQPPASDASLSDASSETIETGADNVIKGQSITLSEGGIGARWHFEEIYDTYNNGDWYRENNNEKGGLAWSESYVMMALATMFRATGSPLYLERLAWHIDAVQSKRDDRRGVTDYRGVSDACWRNTSYHKDPKMPYCYVVHSGMLTYPTVEFARLVRDAGLEEEISWDGTTFGAKADTYIQAARDTVRAHDDQWNDAGYYINRPDASFLAGGGKALPLNQSNAMGRALLALYRVTGDAVYLDKATKLAQRFKDKISNGTKGEYLWNYNGTGYSNWGEDISHAAINVDFAALAAEQGVIFTDADMERFTRTFMENIYVNDHQLSDYVGGGSTNGKNKIRCSSWLRLANTQTSVYTAVRNIFEKESVPDNTPAVSHLNGWAALAEYEPIHVNHFFYYVDWIDQGDWRKAEAAGANILTTPPNLDQPAIIDLEVDVTLETDVNQWDGTTYHKIAHWLPTGGPTSRFVPYETRWPFVKWNGGVLFEFAGSFESEKAIRVRESFEHGAPTITSSPPSHATVGTPLDYVATGQSTTTTWWAMSEFPIGARIDHATGAIDFTPPAVGTYPFTIRLQNDYGFDEQSFSVVAQ